MRLLDAEGTKLSADEIYHEAVRDMYSYCHQHDLAQVWAYLWNRWYNPNQWPLWACSACCLQSNSTSKNYHGLWIHLETAKMTWLRLDLVTHIMLNTLLPRIWNTLDHVYGLQCHDCPRALSSWQTNALADWKEMSKPDEYWLIKKELALLKAPSKQKGRAEKLAFIEEEKLRPHGTYHTDMQTWTCSCPSYLISRVLMCKHIFDQVNAQMNNLPLTDRSFWLNLRCQHYTPFYSIPGIHTTDGDCTSEADNSEVKVLLLGTGKSKHRARPAKVQPRTCVSPFDISEASDMSRHKIIPRHRHLNHLAQFPLVIQVQR